MTSEYGYKPNPHRKLRKQKGIKGMRRTLFNTHVPSTIDQSGILAVRFPDLGPNDVIVPGTSKLSFKMQLNSDDDANRTMVNNLGRAIVSKLEVKLEGRSIYTLDIAAMFFYATKICGKQLMSVQTLFIRAFNQKLFEK